MQVALYLQQVVGSSALIVGYFVAMGNNAIDAASGAAIDAASGAASDAASGAVVTDAASGAVTMHVYTAGDPEILCRPCVDCGRRIGNYCDAECSAASWIPSEVWAEWQITPQCTECELNYIVCHYCRGVRMCTPPEHSRSIG